MIALPPIELVLRNRLTLDVQGADELGAHEPALIVANYASPADPLLVLTALPTAWRARTAVALPDNDPPDDDPPDDELPRRWRPPRRTKTSRLTAELAAGRSVLCFPEGQRSRDGFLAPFRGEVAERALALQVAVVPVGIRGSYAAVPEGARWPEAGRPRVSVRIGRPLHAESDESAGHLAGRLHDEVRRLIEEDATSWWLTQRNAEDRSQPPPTSTWRRIWAQTEAPTAGGKPRRSTIWRH